MITKENAIHVLRVLESSGILSEEIEEDLNDICICIEQIENGLDLFGADDEEVSNLFVGKLNPYESSAPYNTDELKKEYDEWMAKCDAIAEKHKIKV